MQTPTKLLWMGRISLFIIFFWFGLLKLLSLSPAEGLVRRLHEITLSHLITSDHFLVLLGIVECGIGILWLFPKLTKLAFIVFIAQMCATFLPLLFLTGDTWTNSMVLTLTGQYIVKNLALVALAAILLFSAKQSKNGFYSL